MLAGNLLRLGDVELIAVLVENEHFLAPGLVNLAHEELAHLLRILLVNIGLLDIHDAALEVLANVQDAAAAEGRQGEKLGVGIADLVIVVTAVCNNLLQCHFGAGILNFLDDLEVLVDLAGSLVNVDDNVEVVGTAESLGDLG